MSHHHGHSHAAADYNRAFAVGVALNTAFVLLEAGYGIAAHSLALLADAGHNLSDVAGLLLAWGGSMLAQKPGTERRTYGFRKATILASLFSTILLFFAVAGITWEAVERFFNPQPVHGFSIMLVAGIGVVINLATALLFLRNQAHDLNIRGAFLHMAADAGLSLAVVLTGVLIMYGGWLWLDPAISLLVAMLILFFTWGLFRESLNYSLDAVPQHIDDRGIKRYLASLDPVTSIHDLHIWPLSTTEVALTVHMVVDINHIDNDFLASVQRHLYDAFRIKHATIQVERVGSKGCMLHGGGVQGGCGAMC